MLKRESLREQIKNEIRDRIISGSLTAEDRLSEIDLAADLGVSRTPLREALIALEQDGFLEASPGRGFSILPLTHEEHCQLHPVIGSLERIALLASPAPSLKQLEELRMLNVELIATDDIQDRHKRAEARVRADIMWHEVLLESSSNRKAIALLHNLKLQWRRYEFAFWSSVDDVSQSSADHSEIIDCLTEKDLEKAATLLEQHWGNACSTIELLNRKISVDYCNQKKAVGE